MKVVEAEAVYLVECPDCDHKSQVEYTTETFAEEVSCLQCQTIFKYYCGYNENYCM